MRILDNWSWIVNAFFCPITNQLSLTLWMRDRSQISDLSPVPLFYTLQFFHCLIFPSAQFLNANLLIFIFKDMFPCWRKFVRRCVFFLNIVKRSFVRRFPIPSLKVLNNQDFSISMHTKWESRPMSFIIQIF